MYKFSGKEKERVLNALRSSTINNICRRYKICRYTLYRWRNQYDGTVESLEPKFSRATMIHPNAQTTDETKNIRNLIRRNPSIGLNELYGKLYDNYGYRRNPITLYRYLRKIKYYDENKPKRKPYVPKPYITPLFVGEKWQMDVKYIPRECYSGKGESLQWYQYTVIDEASRKRFIQPYMEHNQTSTVKFVFSAIKFFGYIPKMIQTDNGLEFTFRDVVTKDGRVHLLDELCHRLRIKHKLIRPRTPRHNGKVERSHRNDNERFYKHLKYFSFEDLESQMAVYLKRSNNIPSSVLRSGFDKRRWLSPNQKEKELLGLLA